MMISKLNINTVKMIQRHHETRRFPDRIPAKLSNTISNGVRKPTPNTRIVRKKKDRYRSTETIFSTFSGVNPSRISRPNGNTKYAKVMPAAKSGVATAAKPTAQRRSLRRSPGVTNLHSW